MCVCVGGGGGGGGGGCECVNHWKLIRRLHRDTATRKNTNGLITWTFNLAGRGLKTGFNLKCCVTEYRCLYLLSQSQGVGTGFFRTTAGVHSAVRVCDVCSTYLNFLRAAGVYAERFTAGPKLKACGFCLVFVTSCFSRACNYISRSRASYCQYFLSMAAAQAEERFELPSRSLYLCVWPCRSDMIR